MGRVSRGVRGIRLRPGDHLIGMEIVDPEKPDLLAVTEYGFGKRTPIDQYRAQGRGGQGVINIRTSERNGNAITSFLVNDDSDIMIITESGKLIRLPADQVRLTVSRSTQGVKLIDLNENDRVADVSLIPPEEDEQEAPGEDEPRTNRGGGAMKLSRGVLGLPLLMLAFAVTITKRAERRPSLLSGKPSCWKEAAACSRLPGPTTA